MSQHASLTEERWSGFPRDQQVLMIANEMNRARKLMGEADGGRRRNAYERVLRLVDLTVRARSRPAFRRELLRWRDLVAGLYLAEAADPELHAAALRCLLRFTPAAAAQIPLLLGLETDRG